jgi:hypothetical protein
VVRRTGVVVALCRTTLSKRISCRLVPEILSR